MATPSTTPTTNGIPSQSFQDLLFNTELLDILVNASDEEASTRLGVSVRTWRGYKALLDQLVAEGEGAVSQAEAARDAAQSYAEAASAIAVGDPSGLMTVSDAGDNSRPLSDRATDVLDIKDFHAFGSPTVTEDYQYAADAVVNRTPIVKHDEVQETVPTVSRRSNVVFRGVGEIAGSNWDTGFYRREVISPLAPTPVACPDPRMNLEVAGDSVRIVVTGDSLTTFAANTLAASDGFTQRLHSKLLEDNPDFNIELFGRGIGAQTYKTLDDLPQLGFPVADQYKWYTDDTRPWLDYVADLSPDYVVVSMGMNDKQNFDSSAMESVIAKIYAMGAKPVLATCMVPNLSPADANSTYGAFADQEGRDSVAGWVRTYAQEYGIPLIDVNRTFNMVRDGRDILDTYLVRGETEVYETPSGYIAADQERCRDFVFYASVEPEGWTNPDPLALILSPASIASNNVIFMKDSGGFLAFSFYKGGPSPLYKTVVSDIPTPTTAVNVEVGVKGGVFQFRAPGTTNADKPGDKPFTVNCIRYGGLVRPSLIYFGTPGDGPLNNAYLMRGKERQLQPATTDFQMWGDPDNGFAGLTATGGNAINHPTSFGSAVVYGEHFKRQNYAFVPSPVIAEVAGRGSYIKRPDGTMEAEVTLTLAGGATGSLGELFYSAPSGWTFPVNFIEPPRVFADSTQLTGWVNTGNISNSAASYRAVSPTSTTDAITVNLKAFGRWR